MPWLPQPPVPAPQEAMRRRFDLLLGQPAIVQAVGVYSGLTARLAADAGFSMLFLSGAALSASRCLADVGLIGRSSGRLRPARSFAPSSAVDCRH